MAIARLNSDTLSEADRFKGESQAELVWRLALEVPAEGLDLRHDLLGFHTSNVPPSNRLSPGGTTALCSGRSKGLVSGGFVSISLSLS